MALLNKNENGVIPHHACSLSIRPTQPRRTFVTGARSHVEIARVMQLIFHPLQQTPTHRLGSRDFDRTLVHEGAGRERDWGGGRGGGEMGGEFLFGREGMGGLAGGMLAEYMAFIFHSTIAMSSRPNCGL